MNPTYDKQTLVEGNRRKSQAEERPGTFAMYNGEVDVAAPNNLDLRNQSRMAGEKGAGALELMSNPQAIADVDEWMTSFAESNQGAEFNATKDRKAQELALLEKTNAMLGR